MLILLFFALLHCALHATTPYDQQANDLEQERFLLQWRERHKK